MSNSTTRERVGFEDADGERHEFRFDLAAMADLQEELKVDDLRVVFDQFKDERIDFRTMAVIAWAGLLHEDRSRSRAGTLALLSHIPPVEAMMLLADALSASLGRKVDDEASESAGGNAQVAAG